MTINGFGRGAAMVVVCAGLSIGAGIGGGCESQKDKAADSTRAAVGNFQDELNKMPQLIDDTTEWMRKATSGQNARRADDFREFQKSLAKMRERANLVAREQLDASKNSEAYFRAWAREANRTKAADRPMVDEQIAASKSNRDIALGYFENARKSFTDLVASMTSIETRMSKDMSEAAVMGLDKDVTRAINDALATRNSIDRLDDQINAVFAARK